MLRFDRKQQNSIKQLSFNKKNKKKSYYEMSFKLPIFKILKSIATNLQNGNFGLSIFKVLINSTSGSLFWS